MGEVNRRGLAGVVPLLLLAVAVHRPAVAGVDPTGEWQPIFDEDPTERVAGPEIGDYLGLPINEAGRLRSDTWDARLQELPENQCRAHGSDYGWRGPSGLSFWKDVDKASQKVIAYHTHLSAYGSEQTLWMDGRPHPPDYARHTWAGFTTGEWEGNNLVLTTTHLKENWLRLTGIPRSDQATARTHILRHGNLLTVAVITYDPVYLSEPLIRTTDFRYDPNQRIAPWPCVVANEVERPPGVVPHHLIGENPFLDEFPAKNGIPPAAARGGAETMYPEYAEKVKTLPMLPRPPVRTAKP
jgi:hypothetical protein